MSALILLIIFPGVLLGIPAVVLFIEIIAALPARSPTGSQVFPRSARVAVIVPAHNEEEGLLRTLGDLQSQVTAGDRIVVVADNCSDDTASIALRAGVQVVVRNDTTRIGKGYALNAGIQHIADDPPHVVLFCDADCRVEPDMIDRLAAECQRSHRPVQASYLMKRAHDLATEQSFAEFAWMVKNLVRPLGLHNLSGPCQLMGTGMMFPWDVIRRAPLASGNLVEDLQLGLDLALQGSAPLFVPLALTTSVFPASDSGVDTQRKRWVEGHLATITGQVPRLLAGTIRRADLNLLVLALDLAVPPTVLLAGLIVAAWCLAGVAVLGGLPLITLLPATLDALLLGASLAVAWVWFGSVHLRPPALSNVYKLLQAKSRVYLELARGRKAGYWIRTERGVSGSKEDIQLKKIEINVRLD